MNNNQSSIQQLFQKLWDEPKDKFTWNTILKQMEQLHKAEITRAASRGYLAASDDMPLETATGYGNLYYASQFNYPSCEGDNMNNNPETNINTGNTGTNINLNDLQSVVNKYLNDTESYGTSNEFRESTIVLNDFMLYVEALVGENNNG